MKFLMPSSAKQRYNKKKGLLDKCIWEYLMEHSYDKTFTILQDPFYKGFAEVQYLEDNLEKLLPELIGFHNKTNQSE